MTSPETPNTFKEQVASITEQIQNYGAEKLDEGYALMQRMHSETSEAVLDAQEELQDLRLAVEQYVANNEIAQKIKDAIHSQLDALRRSLGTVSATAQTAGKEAEKWHEKLFGDGLAQLWDTVEKWKTSLAFSLGGAIETLKQSGDKEKKPGIKEWLLSFFFSSDEITLTKALKAHNFTSIDLKSGERLSNFILKVKSHYSAKEGDGKPTQLDFFLAVAEKARENTDGATVTLKQLEQFADAVKVSVPVQTKEAVPDQGIVRYLHETIPHHNFVSGVTIDGIGRVRFSADKNMLEVDGLQWQFTDRKARAVDWKNGNVFEVAYADGKSSDFLNKEKFTDLCSLMKTTTDENITMAGAFTLEKVS